ncbi:MULTISPECIES: LacI family DNA-binding transcriptional regulator [unclassified Streptococcus]|uniref:LacI family DNA-binding transcriptional regulator n=1 Tax=unclassified Streptococcus TaxID=2608887 RepID=UPI0010717887|nr:MULTISPECIES: LacI family DNA-binding transcriptional regulator [unclassified Streptococcus]MBF0787914.1 LacI family DNA-binding transcriptional regulator [Streptococcus sp. 19428wC2_LYSM12]MCQ9211278.1 LacI family DNA-binding transcriptional regulator [Streptococcus sp. B01]MCQ9214591.1 LacI family DNA-binding transcriptional regulator [Streptococcus sp. O1]TFV05034.1 LacI family transcriptional regulator [Streptococcus sp. LYSM12]
MVAKLTDVAKLAGVSPTTVSRVINKKGYLSEKTIKKVTDAMRELGYKPNNFARGLQGKSAKLVGLIFPTISNLFYAELIEHLEKELFNRGYKAIICNSQHDSAKEREYLEMLTANQVDGIISGSHNLGIKDYDRVSAPIIAFDRNLSPSTPIVSSDNYSGGVLAAKTLEKAGCKQPVMITGNDDSNSPTGLRQTGFSSVFPQAEIYHVSSDFSPVRKEMEIRTILQTSRADGMFISGDLTAILVWNIAQSLGLSVPKDLKLIGYDGTYFIESHYPQLTTIKQPLQDIAILMVDLLIQKIKGATLEPHYTLPISLLAGRSI